MIKIKSNSKEKIWKVGIYARISREDEKSEKYKEQSESIENQINFLIPIIEKNGWELVEIYKDDGYTGTNFERPDFLRMLRDIELEKINLVITKDLSRLGRDYIEVGKFIERYFPVKNVRYIAVNDNVDTYDINNINNDITPFKAVFNDMYSKDISKKVRTSITTKAKRGECIKAFLPYGYKKSINDKNVILVDEEVADNIKLIFDLYKNGKSKKEIATILNEKNIITPLKYKEKTTNYYNPNSKYTYRWNTTSINKILRDRTYTGDLVQLKYNKVNYKIKKVEKKTPDEYVIIKNNHVPIIDNQTFNLVQDMLNKQTNEWNYGNVPKHLLSGLAFCECGGRITYIKNSKQKFRCMCSNYKKYGKSFCTNVHINEDELVEEVIKSLKNSIKKNFNINGLKVGGVKDKAYFLKSIQKLNKMKEETNRIIGNLYETQNSGQISQDTFFMLVQKYEEQRNCYERKIQSIKQDELKNEKIQNMSQMKIVQKVNEVLEFKEINQETKSLIFKLIDKIIIDDKNIEIKYKFK